MKFAIACYMQLFLELGESLPDYNIGLMLTSDEETGGANGAGSLAKKGYSSRIMLLPDGGENWSIQKSAKGVLQLHIISSGKSAHGARPWLGQNAIELLYAFLVDLKEAFPQEPCGDNDHYHNTLTIGKIEGGQAVNQVPMTASADIDIRYTADTSAAQLKKLIERLQLSHPGIMLSQTATAPSYQIDKHNLYLSLLVEVMKKEGVIDTPVFINSHGSSDARYFMEKNIPVILLRPVGGGLHSESEWIDIKSIRQFYSIVKQFVMETGKGGDNNGRERNGTGTGSSHR